MFYENLVSMSDLNIKLIMHHEVIENLHKEIVDSFAFF